MATIPSTSPQLGFINYFFFKPWYTPQQMLELGVFGGAYFNTVSSQKGISQMIFENVSRDKYQSRIYSAENNYFGVEAPRRMRQFDIPHFLRMQDPEGWFQWYCRFYYNRTSEADVHRIDQWRNEVQTLWQLLTNASDEQKLRYRQYLLEFGWDYTKDPATHL